MSEFGHAPATDPSLRAGNQKQIDPGVLALVANPDSLTDPAERRRAINESMRLTWPDSKVAFDEKGTPHFAQEVSDPGRLFAFNGTIRAPQDKANAPDQLTPGEQMMVIGNQIADTATHLIIETDDGEMYLIKRTAESWNGDDQTFTIASTTQPEAGHRELPSRALKDVVAMIGEPLVMGKDESGKNLKTRGAVTKVTGFNMVNPPVDSRHPWLNDGRTDVQTDVIQRFGEAMKEAKERELAKAIREPLGEEAVEQTVAIQQTSETTGAPQAEQHSPYERFDRKELGQITDNVIGSLVDGIRKYDPAEVERTLRNLLNIQRELERRFDEYKPAHERNTREKAVLYVTQLSPRIINRIYAKLEGIDGGFYILSRIKASYPEMPIGESGSVDDVTLENTEIRGAMYDITKKRREELQKSDSSNFYGIDKPINPYSTKTNEELGELVQRFKQSIAQERAKGKEPTALIDNLMLIGKVIKYRES